jgi:hypothetical protein
MMMVVVVVTMARAMMMVVMMIHQLDFRRIGRIVAQGRIAHLEQSHGVANGPQEVVIAVGCHRSLELVRCGGLGPAKGSKRRGGAEQASDTFVHRSSSSIVRMGGSTRPVPLAGIFD